MLGYVLPDKGELKVREYEIYTGYYCGICKYIGRAWGQLPRMVLSYDAAFIALLLAAADPAPDQPRQEHCAVHHIRYKTVIRNRAIEYAGDLMLILAWFKLLDDAQDEGRTSAKAGLTAFRPLWRKLQRKHPELCDCIDRELAALNELERANCPSIDRVAEGFAQVMAAILRQGALWLYGEDAGYGNADRNAAGRSEAAPAASAASQEDAPAAADRDAATDQEGGSSSAADNVVFSPALHETFAKIGYHLGKWIYLIDAADDIEENLESGSYNPLLYRFGYRDGTGRFPVPPKPGAGRQAPAPDMAGPNTAPDDEGLPETAEAFRARIDEALRFNLFHYLAVISESLESLEIQKNSGIIENIIYLGLNRRTEEVLRRIQPQKRKRSRL